MDLSNRIRSKAIDLGFDLVGIAPAHAAHHAEAFRAWLQAGYAGEMGWLSRDPERRVQPDRVLAGARSVVAVGWSYFVDEPPRALWDDPSRGRIARYAWGPDYHDRITPRLKDLAAFIRAESGGRAQTRYYVDTGPVLEREVAARAGLGFVGKNTLLIHPDYGSYVFLAEILVDVELDSDAPARDGGATLAAPASVPTQRTGTCGTCRRCIDICPTHAFPSAYVLNSNRCISYLTIELRGAIPVQFRPTMKNWIFGCDECQSVCPWVKQYSRPNDRAFLSPDPDHAAPSLTDLMALGEAEFRHRFRGTPILRTKRRGLLRNVAVALGNWGDPAARDVLRRALADEEPLIREHAAWALEQIRRTERVSAPMAAGPEKSDMRNPKDIVREGYDKVSRAYRGDIVDPETDPDYDQCIALLRSRISDGSRILDLGCGCGIPAAKDLTVRHHVTGVDISPVQIERAQALVPSAAFICADMADLAFSVGEFDAIISLYAIIHVPLDEQPTLFQNMARWLRPGGWLLCTVGHQAWTGTEEDWLGVPGGTMFWSHADQKTYETWLTDLGFRIAELVVVPEGQGAHTVLLAQGGAGP